MALSPEQSAWIADHVARGEFASPEEAVRQLLDERIAERAIEEHDDMVWARPLVDEALEDVARGKITTREQHEATMDALAASVRAK